MMKPWWWWQWWYWWWSGDVAKHYWRATAAGGATGWSWRPRASWPSTWFSGSLDHLPLFISYCFFFISVMIIQQHFTVLRDSHLETVQNDKRGWHFAIKLSSKVRTWGANFSWIFLLKPLLQYKEITWWLCLCWLWWWRRWRWLYLPSCVCTAKAPGGSPEKLRSGAAAIFQNSHNDPFWKRSISGERAS